MENQPDLKKLYTKLLKKEISEQELLQLNAYFATGDGNELRKLIRLELEFSDEVEEATPEERAILKRVQSTIADEKFQYVAIAKARTTTKLWRRIAAVAAIVSLVLTTILFYSLNKNKTNQYLATSNDLAPIANSATLTLANGHKIILSDANKGQLAKEAGVSITKSKNGQLVYEIVPQVGIEGSRNNGVLTEYNMLSTAKGETYQIVLPDKSVVWLNAASSLKYPTSFANLKERKVILHGEGYFEIFHNTKQPFRVETKNQVIEDIGTSFNVNSYNDEPDTKTTLVEGSVKIASQSRKDVILRPGEQAVNSSTAIRIAHVDTEEVTSWKDGVFVFKGTDFKSAMRIIGRCYNAEVVYENSVNVDIELGGWISRKNNLLTVLKWIESTNNVHFKVKGRRITVIK